MSVGDCSQHLAKAVIHLDRICSNYEVMLDLASRRQFPIPMPSVAGESRYWPGVLPVVKADGYGHGHIAVGTVLCRAGAPALASGCVPEAVQLRQGLKEHGYAPVIVALMGAASHRDWELAVKYDIVPVVYCFEQLDWFDQMQSSGALNGKATPIALKFDSGMGRLGFASADVPALLQRLVKQSSLLPALALSHLANADDPARENHVMHQAETFSAILAMVREQFPDVAVSLCNSAGSLLQKKITAIVGEHILRPGLAIYGIPPHDKATFDRLPVKPAMEVYAPVLALRTLAPGQGTGYGLDFTAVSPTPIAIVGIGYADAFSRGLSERGSVCLCGVRVPIVGRISMQMIAVDVRDIPQVCVGDKAYVMGGEGDQELSCHELAARWGTIPHEVICLLGGINGKEYKGM